MARVSLLGDLLAKKGAEFVFSHPCEVADRCPVARTCQNLELGRRYKVVATRPVVHAVCTEHEGGARVVEVEPVPLVSSFEAAKLRGTMGRWKLLHCVVRGCPNWDTCFNPGMKDGAEYQITQVGQKLDCPMGYDLRRVQVEERKAPGSAPST